MSIVASDPVIAGPPQGDAGPFCGISEYVVNELRKEVFIRGYLAAEGSAVEPTVLLADGATLAASRSGIDRPDLGEFHGELAELPCGFEFTLPLSRTEGWPAGRVPICGQSRSGRPLRLLVQYAQRRLSAEVRIDGFEISLIENTLVIDGKFVGNVGIVPTTIRLNGIPLHAHMTTSGEPERENSTRPFSIRATGSTRIGLRNHQVFLGTGDVVEVDFCIGESAYRLNWHTKLEPRHMLPVVGAIHSLRYSPASHMLEVRGAFAGNFSSGQVKLVIAGKEQSRAAKIAAEPRLVTGPIGRLFDAPFGEWIWCDQFDLPSSSRTRLTVELRDGPRVLGHTHTTLSAGSVEQDGPYHMPL